MFDCSEWKALLLIDTIFFCFTAVLEIKASDRYKDAEKFGSFHYRIYHPTKVLSLVILEFKILLPPLLQSF